MTESTLTAEMYVACITEDFYSLSWVRFGVHADRTEAIMIAIEKYHNARKSEKDTEPAYQAKRRAATDKFLEKFEKDEKLKYSSSEELDLEMVVRKQIVELPQQLYVDSDDDVDIKISRKRSRK